MQHIPARDLQAGMILGAHAVDGRGQVLVRKGSCLTARECLFLSRRKGEEAVVIMDANEQAPQDDSPFKNLPPEQQKKAEHVCRIFANVRGDENMEALFALVMRRLDRLFIGKN